MISPITGEVLVPGWIRHFLRTHPSEHGSFEVEAVSDRDGYIKTIAVSHVHPFYQPGTPKDAERRAFHEGIIASELRGQRDFSWGEVHSRLDLQIKDWLVIVYSNELPDSLAPSQLLFFLYSAD